MARRTLFVDTNLFLHYRFFEEVDWGECVSGDEVVLALCPAMTAELDKKKFAADTPKIRERAKSVIRRLTELDPQQPVRFREGCWLWFTSRNPEIDFTARNLSRDIPDHVILASALEYAQEHEGVALLSADFGMRMNARNRGLAALAPPDEWLLADEPDDRDRELRELKRQVAAFQAASPDLKLTIGGKNFVEFEVKPREPLSPSEIEAKLAAMRKRHPVMQPQHGINSALNEFIRMPSIEAIRRYNQELRGWFEEYTAYLKAVPAIYDRRDRAILLALRLDNNGTQAGQDVDIIVTANADGCWRANKPGLRIKLPEAPKPPRSPFTEDYLSAHTLDALRNIQPLSERLAPRPNAVARKLDQGAPQQAGFHVILVKPQLPVELPTRYFEFASWDAARSFTIGYRLIAPSSRASKEGEIHIRVTNGRQ